MQTSEQSKSKMKSSMNPDIVNIILDDHKPLKELIEVMKDEDSSPEEKANAFEEFAPMLVAHAKPEEDILYSYMRKEDELKEEAFEGEVEHGIADQLVEEIKRTTDQDMKSARIKVLAEVVEHHIEEEEESLLPDFKEETDSETRIKLGNLFLKTKLQYLAAGGENIIPDPKLEKENLNNH